MGKYKTDCAETVIQYTTTSKEHFTDHFFFTADERQPWMNYGNNGNNYLIIEAIVCSEYSNI